MARLDVTRVIRSPMLSSQFQVVRTKQRMVDGRAANEIDRSLRGLGVVTQAGGDVLKRLPEGARVEGSISIVTQFPLVDSDGSRVADRIIYRGRSYVVTLLSDYGGYGPGFVEATCTLEPLT